jgi:Putative polyhydroxyalkanoic acid system protein (PHA_gran_rgn)
MSETLTVLVPHQLGKEEALRRLKAGLYQVEQQFHSLFVIQDQVWTENKLQFQVRALGQVVRGTIEVEERQVKLDVLLPWIIARLAKTIQRVVESQGTRLLEKK